MGPKQRNTTNITNYANTETQLHAWLKEIPAPHKEAWSHWRMCNMERQQADTNQHKPSYHRNYRTSSTTQPPTRKRMSKIGVHQTQQGWLTHHWTNIAWPWQDTTIQANAMRHVTGHARSWPTEHETIWQTIQIYIRTHESPIQQTSLRATWHYM